MAWKEVDKKVDNTSGESREGGTEVQLHGHTFENVETDTLRTTIHLVVIVEGQRGLDLPGHLIDARDWINEMLQENYKVPR